MARRASNVTRTRIQVVALALFATRGYDATSLQEIASALDVTKAALYYHFPSKAALLHSLADPLLDGERTLLAGYTDGPLDDAARRALMSALIDVLLAHRPVVAWLTRDLSALAQPEIGERVEANTERLQRLLAGADQSVAGQVRAAAAVGALTRPVAVLNDVHLGDLRGTILAAALGALGMEQADGAAPPRPCPDPAR
jgi:AcrR family transcriptional regulator